MQWRFAAIALLMLAGFAQASQESATSSAVGSEHVATEIRDRELSFLAYSAPDDAAIVKDNSASISRAYRVLVDSVGVDAGTVNWAEIAFTRDENYMPPRDKAGVARWAVPLTATGTLGTAGVKSLFLTIPHEQVHAIQKAFGELPRWFSEGMAEWAGLRATKLVAPDLYVDEKQQLDAALQSATAPPNIKSWGGVKPKPEAIFKQLTPEQKQRMVQEPGYFPPGPFTFGPDDFISDESNTPARYEASLRIFEEVESRSSLQAMHVWFKAVRDLPSPKATSDIVRLAEEATGVDISGMVD